MLYLPTTERPVTELNIIMYLWLAKTMHSMAYNYENKWVQHSCIAIHRIYSVLIWSLTWQATGLDAEASRVKCPARFVSHLHEIYIYIWVVYSFCLFCCLFIIVTWWYISVVYCVASGKQEKVQACLVTVWLFIISCHSLSKTTLGSLCSWKPAWSLKKCPHSMCLKPFVNMCIFVVIQICWSLRKYREQ